MVAGLMGSTSAYCTWPRSTLEARVERGLCQLLETGRPFDYAAVRELVAPAPPQVPQLPSLSAPDLKVYDALLQGVG